MMKDWTIHTESQSRMAWANKKPQKGYALEGLTERGSLETHMNSPTIAIEMLLMEIETLESEDKMDQC